MRIIAGEFRGRRIQAPRTPLVRPTTDRVKESIFTQLENRDLLDGARVLDLFAGSGTLGLESLSRGAAFAVFVDNSMTSIRVIRRNVETLHVAERSEIVCSSARRFLRATGDPFRVLFVDPPYAFDRAEYHALTDEIHRRRLCAPEGLVMVKYTTRLDFEPGAGYTLAAERRFGETTVRLYHPVYKEEDR